jgi:hypothetical protein
MIFTALQIPGLECGWAGFFIIDQYRSFLKTVTGTRYPLNNSPGKPENQHFSLQKMENKVTLLARVISQEYGSFAQPANTHVGNNATITHL